jgi:peptidoglycan/xylan/chitin deacetylase (PgdA/CDA1 family)
LLSEHPQRRSGVSGAAFRADRPAILMYHRIANESFDPWGLSVAPARFREQVEWIAEHRTVMSLTDFALRHRERDLPRDAVAITFDDGYECSAEIAAPVLRGAGLPATIFIPAALIERACPFWWDELKEIVLGNERESIRLGDEQIPLGSKHESDFHWSPDAPPRTHRQRAFHRIWAALRERSPADIERSMEQLRVQSSGPAGLTPSPMNPAQVRATASSGIEFGSHTLTHPWLTALSSEEKQREIRDSVDRCQRLAGERPATIAYPYGNFDAECERMAEDSGFACACATLDRFVGSNSSNFALPRIAVGDWNASQLGGRLANLGV